MKLDPAKISKLITAHKNASERERKQDDRYTAWYRSEYWGKNNDMAAMAQDSDVAMESNYAYGFIDTMIASIVPPNPQATVLAYEQEDKEAATNREHLINDVFYRSRYSLHLAKLAALTAIAGIAFEKVVWSKQHKRPKIRILPRRFVWYDRSIESWEDVPYVIEVTVISKEDFDQRIKDKTYKKPKNKPVFGAYPDWLLPLEREAREAASAIFNWVIIYEVFDIAGDAYYHYAENQDEPLFVGKLPYNYLKNPFKPLIFNLGLDGYSGISDIQLIDRAINMLNELDTLELRHAQASIPVTVVHEGLCRNPAAFKEQLQKAVSPGDGIGLDADAGVSIRDVLGSTPTTQLTPSFNVMRSRLRETIEFQLAIPQYSRGTVGQADVATEVALADQAVKTRNGRRLQLLYEVMAWTAEACICLYEQFLPKDKTFHIDGPMDATGVPQALEISRESLGARAIPETPEQAQQLLQEADDDFEEKFKYRVVPYSPTENSKAIQLKSLQSLLPLLLQHPEANPRGLLEKTLSLLQLDGTELLKSEAQKQQEAQAAAAAQGMAPGGMPGAMPPGMPPGGPEAGVSPPPGQMAGLDPARLGKADAIPGVATSGDAALDLPANLRGGPGLDSLPLG